MRNAIEHRPLVVLAIAFATALAWRVNPAACLLSVPLLFSRRTLPFLATGWVVGAILAPAPAPVRLGKEAFRGQIRVVSVPRIRSDQVEFDAMVRGVRFRAYAKGSPNFVLGDTLSVEGQLLPLPDGLDSYARLQGVEGRLTIARASVESKGWIGFQVAEGWRRSFQGFCDRELPTELAVLVEALCLNLDGTLEDETLDRLRATGTIHMVSASGLHVLVIALALSQFLSRLPVPRFAQILITLAILGLYALATGFNPPVLRSVVVWFVGSCAYAVRRDRDALSAMALAAIMYLLWRPRGIFDIGLQLSFVTVAGLVLFGPAENDVAASFGGLVKDLLRDSVKVSWTAYVASTPLIAYHFGTVSLVALPANLLVTLAASCVVVLGLAAHVLSWVAYGFGAFVLALVGSLAGFLLVVLEGLSSLPMAQWFVPAFPGWFLVLIYAMLGLTWRERHVHP